MAGSKKERREQRECHLMSKLLASLGQKSSCLELWPSWKPSLGPKIYLVNKKWHLNYENNVF